MKTIIAGGRDYRLTARDYVELEKLRPYISEVVCGRATGADTCGKEWAQAHGIPVKDFIPDWEKHGNAAGPIRNSDMAAYADALIAFPGGRGTADMIRKARAKGLVIHLIDTRLSKQLARQPVGAEAIR